MIDPPHPFSSLNSRLGGPSRAPFLFHRISVEADATILSPAITILLAVLILGEMLTSADVAGTALVLAGVGWFTLAGRK